MRFDDAAPLTVVLVRHGETELTVSRAMSGSSVEGPALTAAGRVQAAQAADLVHRIGRGLWRDLPYPTAVRASPMLRTRQTAAAVGRRIGAHVEDDAAFAECDFGAWEGLSVTQIEERWPGLLRRWYDEPGTTAPGGESLLDVGRRVETGLTALLADGSDRTVVVAAHAMSIRAAVGASLGTPPAAWAWVRVLAGSVTVLRWWPDGMREAVVVGMPTDL